MSIVEVLKVLVFGIVEGFTEWLPISSTGHMILLDDLIHLNVTEEFREVFMVVIQLGAILAVVLLYFKKLNPFMMARSARDHGEKAYHGLVDESGCCLSSGSCHRHSPG